jgi:hypothetical protein
MLLQVMLMLLQVMLMLLQVMLLPSMSVIVNCCCCSNRNYDQHMLVSHHCYMLVVHLQGGCNATFLKQLRVVPAQVHSSEARAREAST